MRRLVHHPFFIAFLAGCIAASCRLAFAETSRDAKERLTRSDVESAGTDPQAARARILEEIASLQSTDSRLDRVVQYAYLRPDVDPAEREAARQIVFDFSPRLFVERTSDLFRLMNGDSQMALLQAYDRNFPNMKGTHYGLHWAIATATKAEDANVRQLADAICVKYHVTEAYFNLRRRAHLSKGADRIEAIETLGNLGDFRAAIFLATLLDSKERGVPEAAYEALGRLGRAGTLTLKERLKQPDRSRRLLALRALMPNAAVDDLPALYGFVQTKPTLEASLKDELYDLIARLEVIRDKGVETPRQ